MIVPAQPPLIDPGDVRLAVIGEAPGLEEQHWHVCSQGHGFALKHWDQRVLVTRMACPLCGSTAFEARPTPFVGPSGRLLNDLLAEAGLPRDRVLVTNVSRVPLEEHQKFPTHSNVQEGLDHLKTVLDAYRPHCVLLLGNLALRAMHERGTACNVTDYRGSIFKSTLGWKAVAALHPASVLREPSQLALLRFDLQRAVKEAANPTLDLPVRRYDVALSHAELLTRLEQVTSPVAVDIEGTVASGISVIGFADSPENAFTVPFRHCNWQPVWQPDQETALWDGIRCVLESTSVTKVFHNAIYDLFCLRWLHGVNVWPVADTMIEWSVLYPELEKALDVVSSVLTRGEYWKEGLHTANDHERDEYCCQDCCRTIECHLAMQPLFTPAQRTYYDTQAALLEPVLDMMTQGILYDNDERARLATELHNEVFALQGELDEAAGLRPPTFREVAEAVASKLKLAQCTEWSHIVEHAKPSFRKPLELKRRKVGRPKGK